MMQSILSVFTLCSVLFFALLCAPAAQSSADAKTPAKAAGKAYAGKGVLATIPENWRTVESKNYVIFVSPDEGLMVSAQSLDLGSDDQQSFLNAAKAIMENFQGKAFREDGDSVSFSIPGDSSMTLSRKGSRALLLTIQGEGPELAALIASIQLE